jgi:hypothetical protein
MKNREMLANMSNEELAEHISEINTCGMCSNSYYDEELEIYVCKDLNVNCSEYIKQWLEQEVEE